MAERVFPGVVPISGGRLFPSPIQFFTSGEDNLRIRAANSNGGVVIAIQGLRIDEAGRIRAFSFTHTPAQDRSITTETFPIGAGALQNLSVFAAAGAPQNGECFAILELVRGLTGAIYVLGTLVMGYITAVQPLAWPGTPLARSTDGQGALKGVLWPASAAGADPGIVVPSGARWRVINIGAVLTTDATAGFRIPGLRVQKGGATVGLIRMQSAQSASATENWEWGAGLGNAFVAGTTEHHAPLFLPTMLSAGDALTIETVGLFAGDDWAISGCRREWLEMSG
jgi:hypothetical protein